MKISDIARLIDASFPESAGDLEISHISAPENAGPGDLTFLSNSRYRPRIEECSAGAVIVKKGETIVGKVNLEVDDPYIGYARTAQLFEDTRPTFGEGISPFAIIDKTATIHASSSIGPGTIVGPLVEVGPRCMIGAGCIIERGTKIGSQCRLDSGAIVRCGTIIGNNVILQSGSVIGSEGFGNARLKNGEWVRIPCFGNVVLEDEVEIGANTTIDRGNIDPTVIHRGAKLDNLVHIAHNVKIGEYTAIAGQTGISGSTEIGKRVIIAGQVGFVGHITVGDDSFVGAQAGVSKSVGAGASITGYPARDLMKMRRIDAALSELPSLLKEFKKVREEISRIQESLKEHH